MRTSLLLITALVTSCGGRPSSPKPTTVAKPPAPDVAAPAAPVDPYVAQLNLGFEAITDHRPDGWAGGIGAGPQGIDGYETAIDRDAHGGSASLRITRTDEKGSFGSLARSIDATPLRGKRVRLHAWVKTDGVEAPGFAAVWLRVDSNGKNVAFDNMTGRGLVGTEGWREAIAQVDVPAEGEKLVLGPLLVGAGTAWYDDLRLEVSDIAPVKPITLAGVVVDPSGKPAAGATVTLMAASGEVTAIVTTDADGRFRVDAKTGSWGMSAHHASGVGTFFDPREFTDDTNDLRFTLGTDGVRVHGRVNGKGAVPAGAHLEAAPYSTHQTDGFAIPLAADWSFDARLPRGDTYYAKVVGTGLVGYGTAARKGDDALFDITPTVLEPPPAEVNAWVAANAVPLVSPEAGHGFADMKPIARMIGKAHIVGLGEATHGTREFFQLKHRFLEYLVAEQGFTVFVIEANLPECRAINEYVLHGTGDPQKALDGIYFWTWNTQEVLAMIEWMRAWNADPKHTKKVQFLGDDMQTTPVAHANVVAFLKKVAPADADALAAPIAIFGTETVAATFAKKPAEEQKATIAALAALAKRFDDSRAAWSKLAGKDAFLDAREDLRVIQQAAVMYASEVGSFEARDVAMADNLDQILARQPKGTRIVLWAHNGHVGNGMMSIEKNQGHHLRERHGKDYVVFGFAFGEGSFQAIDWTHGQGGGLTEHTLGPAPAWNASAPFHATGKPIVVVDLRKAPKGVVADWFATPHPMRDTGAVFTNEENMSQPETLSKRFDAIIYVDKTTRARPNPSGERPAKK